MADAFPLEYSPIEHISPGSRKNRVDLERRIRNALCDMREEYCAIPRDLDAEQLVIDLRQLANEVESLSGLE